MHRKEIGGNENDKQKSLSLVREVMRSAARAGIAECCASCVYYNNFWGACCNSGSPYRADFTSRDDWCEEWTSDKEAEK